MIAWSLSIGQPIWLLLLLPCGVALMLWRPPSEVLRAMRVLTVVLITLALAEPMLWFPGRSGTVVVVADRSRSMPVGSATDQVEAIRLIHNGLRGDDRIAVVSFGATAQLEHAPQSTPFQSFVGEPDPDGSNLSAALDMAISLIPRESPGRIVVLSDGRWSGTDPTRQAATAAMRRVPIDYRVLERNAAGDVAIRAIDAPQLVTPGEAYTLTGWIEMPVPGTVRYELLRDNAVLASGERDFSTGLHRLIFRDQADRPGTHGYRLRIMTDGEDPVPENNVARRLVGVAGPRPILHVVSGDTSGLARLLRESHLDVVTRSPDDCRWTLEEIARYACVLLENVSAHELGQPALDMIPEWVRETGGGLMMTGGRSSFSTGGYFRSPIEPILPVSMELRQEHRKMALAIVIAMDRSGSMAMPAGGGRTKMDLANLGAAEAVNMLTALDEVGVLAVDTVPHTIVDLTPVEDPRAITQKILKIDSQGGGIFVFEALKASVAMLQKAKAQTRHIILFSDAADSEEPGAYARLLEECRKAGITCSVIGLGSPTDVDAKLLEDIARRGEGRCYFTNEPNDLPRLFAQDTFVVARSAFVDQPVAVQPVAGLMTVAGRGFEAMPDIGGYNLTYLRPRATLGVVTRDEYAAPIVASWQAGLGRVLCYTGQADGQFTGPIGDWADVGAYFASLARWAAGRSSDLPDGMLLTQEIRDGACRIRLHLDPERDDLSLPGLPTVTTLRDQADRPPSTTQNTLTWLDAVTLGVDLPLRGDETVASTVALDAETSIPLLPTCLPYSSEFAPVDPQRGRATLEALAAATGGVERIELDTVWNDLPKSPKQSPIAPWLLLTATALFLGEVLERRTGLLASMRNPPRRGTPATTRATVADRDDTRGRGALFSFFRRKRYQRAISDVPPSTSVQTPGEGITRQPTRAEEQSPKTNEQAKENASPAGVLDAMRKAHHRASDRRK